MLVQGCCIQQPQLLELLKMFDINVSVMEPFESVRESFERECYAKSSRGKVKAEIKSEKHAKSEPTKREGHAQAANEVPEAADRDAADAARDAKRAFYEARSHSELVKLLVRADSRVQQLRDW